MNEYILGEALENLGEDEVEKHLQKKVKIVSRQSKNMFRGEVTDMNQKQEKKKWIIPILIVPVLMAAAILIAVVFGGAPDNPVVETPKESPVGVYYYDTAEGEYVLTLSDGNIFTIAGPNLNKSGKCVVTDNGIELDFVRDEDGAGSVIIDGDILTLQYKDKTMRFLAKKTFEVSFDVNGGSAVETVKVINGKTVAKPSDPQKTDSVFLGWYADEACTQLYGFGTDAVTADTTIYAKWVDTVVGQNEYVVDFDLGYEAEGIETMTTIGGKLYNVPTPTREGYTFGGWWISMTERADQLTYQYEEERVFQANTTLFAQWIAKPEDGKLEAPMVEVFADSIKWRTVDGASTYSLKITDKEGNVVHEEKMGATTKIFSFDNLAAGEYTVMVAALSSVSEKNSDTTTRTYINKALDRVSLFTVIDGGVLLWNRVAGAEKYLITVDCGNDAHNHTDFDNGESGTFVFANCPMQEGGIKFTVTAVAEGKASSVSEVFVYERKLEAVGQILYHEQTQSFYWDAVANATNYRVVITVGEETLTVNNGSATSYCVKHLSGNMTVEVIPETKGYNSPEATKVTYEKKSLATPQGLTVNGNLLSWNEVAGADSYTVKINNQIFRSESNTLDLTTVSVSWDSSATYEISVMADGTEESLYSDVVTMKYLANIESVSYKYNTVSWTPVIGVEKYEIRVNGKVVANVENTTSARIQLTKAGVNVIEVRYTDQDGSDWTGTEVYAYTVIYDSRSLSGVREEYLAMGDTMSLPTDFTHDGYDFAGWYNSPDGAAGNGAAVTDTRFNSNGSIVLYANWTPKTFYFEFKGMNGVSNIKEGEKYPVTYMGGFKLPVPEASDTMGEFVGWFTAPGGSGVAWTDQYGNSLNNYQLTRDAVAYPFFESNVLEYILQADGTYAVKAGFNIASATNVYIPEYHDGYAVTTIMENAFYNVDTVERIYIPATIRTIGIGAFPTSTTLKEINVYTDVLQENYEVRYSSYDGALLRHDMGTVFLEVFPRGKTGEYTIPDNVDVIRDKVFYVAQISKLIVGNKVSLIMRNAFYGCRYLQVLEFKGEGTTDLTIDPGAFYFTENLTTLRLPSRLAQMDLQMLNQFSHLNTVEVEPGGTHYSSVDNMICNALGSAILYAPKGVAGEYEIPLGIREIGPGAFANCLGLTKITIPSHVTMIGDSAFLNSTGITEVIFEGSRRNDLLIDSKAFSGCDSITTVTFRGSSAADTGVTTIGTSAFEGIDQLRTVIFENGTNIIIGQRAFAANEKLTNLTYAENARIQSFGKEAYAGCVQLAKAVIPATLTSVGDGAFSGCERLHSVIFVPTDKNVTFGANVFAGCFRLTTINLPSTLGYFDSSVFAGCESLTEIVVEAGNPNFVTYGGALYSAGYEELLFYPRALDGDLGKLHPDLRKIGKNVFQGNPKVTNLYIGKNIVAIGEYAFENCYNLKSITFEAGGTAMTVGAGAFARCGKLTGIALPAYTGYIGDGAFEGTPLTAFVIPQAVTTLSNKLFKDTKLTSIHIPANVEKIGEDVFYNVPLTEITFAEGEKPLTIGSLGHDVSKTENRNFGVFFGTRITELVLPDRLVSIGDCAFYNQTTLTSVYMSKNSQLRTIGQYAFAMESGRSRLNSVSFGGSLEVIGQYAFYKANLLDITIPRTVTLVDKYAFSDNTYMRSVVFEMGGNAGLTINERAFAGTQIEEITLPNRLEKIYTIVAGNINGFTGAAVFKNVCEVFYGCTKLKAVNVQEGNELFVSKDGILYEIGESGIADILLYCPSGKTGDLVISRDVRRVENGAFATTALSGITFEEYPKDDPNYGQPLLELGIIVPDRWEYTPYAVIGLEDTKNLTKISLPSHLKTVGIRCFKNLTVPGTTVTFNMDSHPETIAEISFQSCSGIKKLELPPVNTLGESAFSNCSALTEVTFDSRSNIKALPTGLFMNCGLVSIKIPATVREIGDSVFYGCTLLTNVTFEEGSQLTKLGENVFGRCTGLTSLVLPENVTMVGMTVIQGCTRLESITLSKNLMRVTEESNGTTKNMFSGCTALESIYVPKDSLYFRSVGGVLYDLAQTIIYCFPQAKDPTGFKLPDTLITIEAYAFEGFKGAEVILPESLETIGDGAFLYTVASEDDKGWLKRVHIPQNVKTIGAAAFNSSGLSEFVSIESLTFAEGSKLETIGAYAFANNHLLKKVVLPDNVSEIGAGAFSWCVAIEEIILPASLKTLQNNTFSGLRNLKRFVMQEGLEIIERDAVSCEVDGDNWALTELTIPSTVQAIHKNAFAGMHGLQTVTFAEGSRLETLGDRVFLDCESLQSITLPSTITTLGAGLFDGCCGLKRVDMSACVNLTDLSSRMFRNCTGVETMLLPPNLVTIGSYLFGTEATIAKGSISYIYGMTSLKQIEIPATVSFVGDYAFNGCTGLEKVVFEAGSRLIALGANVFADTPALKEVALPGNLRSIGRSCFENSGVQIIELPVTVTTIDDCAFKNCDDLVDANLTGSVAYLGDEVYYDCDNLEKAELYLGLEYIGDLAFAYCEKLEEVYIPATVIRISGNPFTGCTGVKSLELDPNSVDFVLVDGVLYDAGMYTLIYYPAFLNAETFRFPTTVFEIATGAFAGAQLKSIVIPEQIKQIPASAFRNSAMESIILHKGITAIGDRAFAGMANLKEIFIEGGVGAISVNAFADLAVDVNIYFTGHTNTEIMAIAGIDWIINASGKAHFYFKNNIPADVELPEEIKSAT